MIKDIAFTAYPSANTTPVCKVTSLIDPEGNKVSLHQSTR